MKGSVAEWFAIINSGHSKAPRVMVFLRFLVLISMKHNFLVRARHVPGAKNEIADALSRFQVQRFGELAPICRPQPLHHPAFLNDLKDEVLMNANWALLWNTNRTYRSEEKRFIQFCLMNRLLTPAGDILPASEGTHILCITFSPYLAPQHH